MSSSIVEKLLEYDRHYHTIGEPLVSDEEYDELKAQLYKIDPNNQYFQRVGSEIITGSVTLPYYMGSMDKIRDDPSVLKRWMKKYPSNNYLIMEKLDGVSAMFLPKSKKLYTRGNGFKGADISKVLKYIQIDHDINATAVRGELIIKKQNWKDSMGTNPRNTVAGLINSKKLNKELLNIVDFVPYQLVEPALPIKQGLDTIKNKNAIVYYEHLNETLTIDKLKQILVRRKRDGEYDIDGIVISDNSKVYPIETGKNPLHAFAFKSIDTHEKMNVTVIDVEWNISKDSIYKPRILLKPVKLDGVTISATTGYNASYIFNNKIGPGAILEIIRSGGVIPKVERVITQSKHVKMPPEGEWTWNETHVDAIAVKQTCREQEIANIIHFFKQMDVKNISKSTLTKLYDNGFDSLSKLLQISKTTTKLNSIEGIGQKMAECIINSIHTIKTEHDLPTLMTASNLFGRNLGIKKLTLIFKHLKSDKILDTKTKISIEDIQVINGIGDVNATQFVENIDKFRKFYHSNFKESQKPKEIKKSTEPTQQKQTIFNNKRIVFTGFRDKNLEKLVEDSGGTIVSTLSKKVDYVITKNKDFSSNTITKAKELGIPVLYKDDIKISSN